MPAPFRTMALWIVAHATCCCTSLGDQPRAEPELPRDPAATEKIPDATPDVTPVPHVEHAGNGEQHLVLVPGLACDWTVWKSFMERHAGRYTMHAVTLPGFGGSAPPPVPPETLMSARTWLTNAQNAIAEAIEQLRLPAPPVIVGHSMGGFLAMSVALHHPGAVSGAVSVDGFAAVPIAGPALIPVEARRAMVDNQMESWFETHLAADDGAGLKRMFRSAVKDEARGEALAAMAATQPSEVVKRYFYEYMASDITAELAGLERPVLVLAAQSPSDPDDPASPPIPDRETWVGQFHNATRVKLVFIENSRHFIQEDQPAAMDEAIAGFIASLSDPKADPGLVGPPGSR